LSGSLQFFTLRADNPQVTRQGGHHMYACTRCAKGALITIRMRIAGREVVFRRCARCEANSWQDDTGIMTLSEVLELARVPN
jgi:hypothetical protein